MTAIDMRRSHLLLVSLASLALGCEWIIGADFDDRQSDAGLQSLSPSGPSLEAAPSGELEAPRTGVDEPASINVDDVPSELRACEASGQETSSCGPCEDCRALANVDPAAVTCDASKCVVLGACARGFEDCDGDPSNGCERALDEPSSCGSCSAHCGVLANTDETQARCSDGRCSIVCADAYADCNGDPADGCEVDLTSGDHCGDCGRACEFPFACAATTGAFICTENCPDGQRACDRACIDVKTSLSHCGACGNTCAPYDNGTATCQDGSCALKSCVEGFADCDADEENGCETQLLNDPNNCGACGDRCSFAGAAGLCTDGVCKPGQCQAGRGNCDTQPANGCESVLASDSANCGACGLDCSSPERVAAGTCSGASCSVNRCDAKFADCNGQHADGCESSLVSDGNCGQCGNDCFDLPHVLDTTAVRSNNWVDCRAATQECVINSDKGCEPGYSNCDNVAANGCESQLNFRTTCGSCDINCDDLANVDSTKCDDDLFTCVIRRCDSEFANCDGTVANGCETSLSSPTACGACGADCTKLANVESASCAASACLIDACDAFSGDCDGEVGNGCEQDLSRDAAHCGACGDACLSPTGGSVKCSRGICVPSCPAGFSVCSGVCVDTASDEGNCGGCGLSCESASPNDARDLLAGSCVDGECLVAP